MGLFKSGIGPIQPLGTMLVLLLIVVLIPTACVLWFMGRTIENERLALRQKLEETYRRELLGVREQLDGFWRRRASRLEESPAKNHGAARFAWCVRSRLADGVLCYDPQGRLLYPRVLSPSKKLSDNVPPTWEHARELEYSERDLAAAATAYGEIAQGVEDVNVAARALRAQVRCLVQSGNRSSALELVTRELAQEKYALAVDPEGRMIVPNVQLLVLQTIADRKDPRFSQTVKLLQKQLKNYENSPMPSSQRRFLMGRLQRLWPGAVDQSLFQAEELAARIIKVSPLPDHSVVPGEGSGVRAKLPNNSPHPNPLPKGEGTELKTEAVFQPTPLPGTWQLVSPHRQVVALFRVETLLSESQRAFAPSRLPEEIAGRLHPPGSEPAAADAFALLPAGNVLPGWQLSLAWLPGGPADAAAQERIAWYLWTSVLGIAALCLAALLLARIFHRQLRLARLKNDLVATVSHELKTPLSSVRLLVDTLLDDQRTDAVKTREYLQLMAKENLRLSRLIDNFLAFSRMERKKYTFQFQELSLAQVIGEAVAAVRERFEGPQCRLEVEVAPDLPPLRGDLDALVTVVVNLLDNAWKYTPDEKHVALRAYAKNGSVFLAVSDNGIGLTRAAAKKVFQRFYQADRRLSRSAGGCGLGLSIVKFIVDAHGGSAEVDSQPGRGSTFVVKLPCVKNTPSPGAA